MEGAPGAVAGFDVHATRSVGAEVADVFAFLADLENHWLLADRFVEVVELAGPPGARTGGRVRVRGPLRLRRTATIRVDAIRPTGGAEGPRRRHRAWSPAALSPGRRSERPLRPRQSPIASLAFATSS